MTSNFLIYSLATFFSLFLLIVNKLSKRLLPIRLIRGKLSEGEPIYINDTEIGKVLINDEYPFALVKYLDNNFKEDSELKSENAVLRIKMPSWIK